MVGRQFRYNSGEVCPSDNVNDADPTDFINEDLDEDGTCGAEDICDWDERTTKTVIIYRISTKVDHFESAAQSDARTRTYIHSHTRKHKRSYPQTHTSTHTYMHAHVNACTNKRGYTRKHCK